MIESSIETLKDLSFGALLFSSLIFGTVFGVRGFWEEDQKNAANEEWH